MNKSVTCIIVDDEQDAINLLKKRIAYLFDDIIVADAFTKWKDALTALRNNQYDLLFCDISMPEKTGLDMLKLLPGLKCEIIFVTAHDKFALSAFSFAASGYILKPIDDQELSSAINKAIERIRNKDAANQPKIQQQNDKIGITNNHGVDYVNIGDIIYLESLNRCTLIITSDTKYTSSANIGSFRHLTEHHRFFQVHRSFIINLSQILRYETSGLIIMQGKKEIPISRNLRNDFLKLFKNQ